MMTQRTTTKATMPIPSAIQDAFASEPPDPVQVTCMRWVCEVCGMKHGTIAPDVCDSCGSAALTLQQEHSTEIGSRW